MHYVTSTTSTPPPDTVLHLLYRDEDGQLSERLVQVKRADATHWRGMDLLKNEFRCFCRSRLFWAKPVTDLTERQDVFYRLLVRQLIAANQKK